MNSTNPLVSVVITCYNQARFLDESIQSVLNQTCQNFEIVIIDDGSTDNPAEVAAGYPGVRFTAQENQGVVAARNAGLRGSRGDYVIFLDADDRLLPDALEVGSKSLDAHPECAFAFGYCRFIGAGGEAIPTWDQPYVGAEHYPALLRACYILMPAVVLHRRSVLDSLRGFDASTDHCSDYDLYLRVTRQFPVHCHDREVAEYRVHGANTHRNSALMLKNILKVLRSQRGFVKGNRRWEEACEEGIRHYKELYGEMIVESVRGHVRGRGEWKKAVRGLAAVLRYYPQGFVKHGYRKLYCVVFGVKA
jgi:glycosyltransferase involved in cell wall biosynthesis